MAKINTDYTKLRSSYLFSTIAKKVSAYSQANPEADIIRLGIGDVTRPLAPVVVEAMKKGELSKALMQQNAKEIVAVMLKSF